MGDRHLVPAKQTRVYLTFREESETIGLGPSLMVVSRLPHA